ncbi:metalloendopeptidase [Aureococcus anophagefferens]|nr:metalloendopeptidase [Aureococcus anophagefferens]
MSPTVHPSLAPTAGPTVAPSLAPTSTPSYLPTVNLTFPPTPLPTTTPSYVPSSGPTPVPTPNPTIVPTPMPSPECPAMEYVYRLWLLDDGGDGWGNCEYSVYADNDDDYVLASGTLESGEYEVIWLCFTDGCYTAEVTDDCKHSSEISLQLDDEEGGKMTVGAGVTSDFCVYEGTWYDAPTASPSRPPTFYPTEEPTALPSPKPTRRPTKMPTSAPSEMPSSYPTEMPTPRPTRRPTKVPTSVPSEVPSPRPTFRPTKVPSPARTGALGRPSHFDFYGAADFGEAGTRRRETRTS